jgi:hypothetical protein
MPTTYKGLGQVKPSADTATTAYTVPASTSAVISSINICNTSSSVAESVNISVRIAGAEADDKQYIYEALILQPTESLNAVLGITLATTDVITVYSLGGFASFNIFGSEIS